MVLVKLYQTGPVIEGKDSNNTLRMMGIRMNDFIASRDVEVIQVDGPYASHFPPTRELPETGRVVYTASVLYQQK